MQCRPCRLVRVPSRLRCLRTGSVIAALAALPLGIGVPARAQHGPPSSTAPHMAADAHPQLEVATIKPTRPGVTDRSFGAQGREFTTLNTTLEKIMEFAYGIQAKQIEGAPVWVNKDPFDLHAVVDSEAQPSIKQWKVLLQELLEERCHLKYHQDQRLMNAYVLQQSTAGPKLEPSKGDPEGTPVLSLLGPGRLDATNATMMDLAMVLQSSVLDRPVIDHTGLQGHWDFRITWTPDETQPSAPVQPSRQTENANTPPPLFTAIQEQVGLRMEAEKAAVPVVVIDNLERPEAN